ncbi:MAG TPA: D-alanine--D-alanine ligase family protein [Syntrophales bacterium]|nr:D-alanine--D-alanine ligase family protein [Syntrophales bacterium]
MKKKTVGLFFGGLSNEADISIISAKNIIKYFDYKKYNLVLVYWHKNNQFYILKNTEEIKDISEKNKINVGDFSKLFDVALPITHGKYGEDGALQGLLEIQKMPYCGCRVLSSSLCMDKAVFKTFLAGHKINQVNFDFIDLRNKKQSDVEKWIAKIKNNFELPVYIKPSNSGSSVGINKVTDFKNLKKAVKDAARHDDKILAEQGLINPREIEVAVLGNEELTISDPGELVLDGAFYDFDEKYENNRTQVAIPAKLDSKTKQEIKNLAEKAYHLCDCKGFARVDFFINNNKVYLNEINTLPGFTDISMFPMLMKSAGIYYKKLINIIIKLAN